MKVLFFLWQIIQNIIGFIISRFRVRMVTCRTLTGKFVHVFYMKKFFKSGVSLGDFIILDQLYSELPPEKLITVVSHENGHSIQSKYLGPFYLFTIGLCSFLGNIYSRIFKKGAVWYYSQPWEHWADELGNVKR